MAGNWHRIGDIKGADGVGVPTGGARGDVLKKEGGTDYATSWGAVNYADIQGKVPASALPEITTAPYVVDSQAAMLNLPAVPGRQAIRTDIGATFVLAEEPASELDNWVEMVSRSDVTSVNGKTGSVELTKADVGLSEVNNTADSDKPVATQSVRGLMSPSDKAKLDKATYVAMNGTLVERSSSGYVNIRQVVLSDQPGSSGHAVPLGYLNSQLEGKLDAAITLGAEDLDTVTAEGVYRKVGSTHINDPALHYPAGSSGAGVLLVTKYSTAGIIQEWTAWGGGVTSNVRKWIRNSNDSGGAWTDWREMAGAELATPSRDGLMSRADKAKLDGATMSGTPSTLVWRNSVGQTTLDQLNISGSAPTSGSHATRKDYVDGELARRGSSTGQLSTGPDLNTLTSPGVFNVGRETLNTPVVAGFFSSCRVEVDVIHSSTYGSNRTVFQTARANAWDTEGPTVGGAFTGAHKNELMASQTFKRESPDGGSTWTDWRAEGTTPWFPMTIRTASGGSDTDGFYGIETGAGYPNVSSLYANGAQWRINNGMVQLIHMFISPQAGSGEAQIGTVSPTLRPPSWGPEWYSAHALTHPYQDFINGIVTVSKSGVLNYRVVGAYGFSGTTASKVDGSNLTWPVPVTSYTI